jgi:protein-disulfide isomerase
MRKILLIILLLFTLTMSACGGVSGEIQANSTQASTDLPIETKLVVGTLKLEGTEQAVTSEQAKGLLVMWQVYQELLSSDTAAQAEIDCLIEQIQETMTAEQMKAVSAMNLTQQDVFALIQEQGVEMGQVQPGGSGSDATFSFSPDGGSMGGSAPPDAGMAGGVPPDGGMAGMSDAGPGTSTDQNQEAGAGPGAGAGGFADAPIALVEALIQVLEQKAGS